MVLKFYAISSTPALSGMGSDPRLWQSLSCFLQLNIFYCLQSFHSAAGYFVRKGQVGRWDNVLLSLLHLNSFSCGGWCLLLERGWPSRCNCCSPALCVLPDDSPAPQSSLPVAGNPVGWHLCQSCTEDEANAVSKAQYFPCKREPPTNTHHGLANY